MVIVFLGAGIAALLIYSGTAPAEIQSHYKKEECVKCHAARVKEIATAGKRHKNVPCIGCHPGHPPEVKKPIEPCSKCHQKTRKAHFELTGCLNCHKNPHTPLNITFEGKDACLNCHMLQSELLRDNESKHSLLDCSTCHRVHRMVPQCTQCHNPHSAEMVVADCKKCHKAHMPNVVTYAADIPPKFCGACHVKPFELLGASKVKHHTLACAFCHQAKHKMMPRCQDCHGSPHPAGIMTKFPKCGECHNSAHDLNNWHVAETTDMLEEVPQVQVSSPHAR